MPKVVLSRIDPFVMREHGGVPFLFAKLSVFLENDVINPLHPLSADSDSFTVKDAGRDIPS
jgi:hypothetical protein